MILTKDAKSKTLFTTINHNNIKETYECTMSVCPNPSCTCGIVDLTFTPVHRENRKDYKTSSITVNINIVEQSLTGTNTANSQEEYNFIRDLSDQIQKEDFVLLDKEHIAYKHHIIEDVDLASINIHFPIEEIERESLMIGYNEILPYEKSLLLLLDGHDYAVLDQYCLKLQCACTEVILSCFLIDGGRRSNKEAVVYLADYKKQTWKKVEEFKYKKNIPDIITVRNAIEQQHPDIYNELQQRHKQLKILYANWRKKHRLPQQSILNRQTFGRNAPCPCGSGKKYKKCCGKV